MKIDITNQKNGVTARLSGFSTDEVESRIEACRNGQCSCDCDPALMAKIDGIDLQTEEDHAVLTVSGDVDADTLAPMMQSCLTGETK